MIICSLTTYSKIRSMGSDQKGELVHWSLICMKGYVGKKMIRKLLLRSQPRASLSSLEMSLSFSNGAARPNLYGEVLGWWVFKNYRYFVLPLPAGVGITIRTWLPDFEVHSDPFFVNNSVINKDRQLIFFFNFWGFLKATNHRKNQVSSFICYRDIYRFLWRKW